MTTSTMHDLDGLDGQLLLPGDDGYDSARAVWNAMIDRHPRMIIRCAGVPDVVAAVRTARDRELEIGVRCGGHSIAGHAVPDGGLMIDLTAMASVRIDPERRRAWVQGGALLGAVDRAAQEFGLATTAGNVSHTGVGGLTLGGGMGWLARQHGLSCDNVLSFEVVTADGRVVRASETENPDLFWGLRGGGGNFGVVTEFEFQLHPVGTAALVAEFAYPMDQASAVLRNWRDLSLSAPRAATFAAAIADGFATVGFVWVGDIDTGQRFVSQLHSLGRPAVERVSEMSYLDLQRREDSIEGHFERRYWKGHYFRKLPDSAIDALLEHGIGSHGVGASLQAYGGAIADVPGDETAFSHRDTMFEYVGAARWTDPAEDEGRISNARRLSAALEPYASGAYVNTLSGDEKAAVRRAYAPEKLAKLVALKNRYDPTNAFHLNQNIKPTPRQE